MCARAPHAVLPQSVRICALIGRLAQVRRNDYFFPKLCQEFSTKFKELFRNKAMRPTPLIILGAYSPIHQLNDLRLQIPLHLNPVSFLFNNFCEHLSVEWCFYTVRESVDVSPLSPPQFSDPSIPIRAVSSHLVPRSSSLELLAMVFLAPLLLGV